MTDLHYLLASTLLTALMLLTGSLMRAKAWTPTGLRIAFGNRDDYEAPLPIAARADRAAKNMLENMVLFTAVLVAGRAANVDAETLSKGAAIFFWSRLAYWPTYLAGVKYARTLFWATALAGLWIIGQAAVR